MVLEKTLESPLDSKEIKPVNTKGNQSWILIGRTGTEVAQIHLWWVMKLSNHLILCYPLLLSSIFPSIRVFSNELALCISWWKYWCFGFSISISPSNEYLGFISFRIDWFDLLAVQGTLKSLQLHSSKTSILWHSAFFVVQLSHPYTTTGKTTALTIQPLFAK